MPNTPSIAAGITTLAIAGLLMATGALAQSNSGGAASSASSASGGPTTTGMAPPSQGAPQAPVGHRQPRTVEQPSTTGSGASAADSIDERITRLNREAGRGLNICRGC
jgi:hypothetical protein